MSEAAPPNPAPSFPASWLVERDIPVADFSLWNREQPAFDDPHVTQFTANWDRTWTTRYFKPGREGVAIGPTFIRHYFGVAGCIIPIAALTASVNLCLLFVLAGPADANGKKLFFSYLHDDDHLDQIDLCHVGRFASVAEFYQRCYVDRWSGPSLIPVDEGKDAAKQVLAKRGRVLVDG
ncbi:hypothetical protein FB45DRAFT_1018428 [Roridomyces roridus]|uniref:Uncharacterized protein n=1 Tax=Roridomyces roridus TaxID=1738132 RepID=A0AAD7FZF9_9AGAR|nr:hypothetical protein FB45DRAFT_1018428 [Roridomyces roridus]